MFADITPTEAKYLYSGDFIREILTIWHARYIKKWFEFICYISYKIWMQQWNSPALLLVPRKSKLWQNQDLIFFVGVTPGTWRLMHRGCTLVQLRMLLTWRHSQLYQNLSTCAPNIEIWLNVKNIFSAISPSSKLAHSSRPCWRWED